MEHLGECIAYFQHIDQALNMCITDLVGCSRKVGKILTTEMSFREKVCVYSALCHHALGTQKLPDDLNELVQRLNWAEQERNKMSHSTWDVSDKLPETILRKKTSAKKGLISTMEEHYTPEDLEELRDLFEGIITDLFYLTQKHIPKLLGKHALSKHLD